jgi:hypothetical protein
MLTPKTDANTSTIALLPLSASTDLAKRNSMIPARSRKNAPVIINTFRTTEPFPRIKRQLIDAA